MIKWLDKHLIDNWRDSWRFGSVQVAAVASAVSGSIAASPALLLTLLDYLPEHPWIRAAVIISVVMVVFIVPTVARLWDQRAADETAAN